MPLTEDLIDDLLYATVEDSVISIATSANVLQMELDGFIRSQGLRLSGEGLRSLIFGGDSTFAAQSVDTFRKAVLKAIGNSVPHGFGEAVEAKLSESMPKEQMYKWRPQSGKPCPDCSARSTYPARTLQDWQDIGVPKSGATICGGSCMCTLTPIKG